MCTKTCPVHFMFVKSQMCAQFSNIFEFVRRVLFTIRGVEKCCFGLLGALLKFLCGEIRCCDKTLCTKKKNVKNISLMSVINIVIYDA